MKRLLQLVLILSAVLPASAQSSASTAVKRQWDETFEGVVHDDKAICGVVADYRWLSNFMPCQVAWDGRVYGSSEAAYQSAKYPAAERDEFTTLEPDPAKTFPHQALRPDGLGDAKGTFDARRGVGEVFTESRSRRQTARHGWTPPGRDELVG